MTNKKEINLEIGKRIKVSREKMGYTQEKFAERIDRSVQYVSDLERGKVGPSIQTLIHISQTLCVKNANQNTKLLLWHEHSGGSLLPCIITHAGINITSAFANKTGLTVEKHILSQFILLVITVAYAFILTKTLPQKSKKAYRQREIEPKSKARPDFSLKSERTPPC